MTLLGKIRLCLVAAIVLLPAGAIAQQAPPPLNPDQIDQLVAPIALHPDKLLAQILMASTYPLEVVQAARFVKENPNLQGEQLSQALLQPVALLAHRREDLGEEAQRRVPLAAAGRDGRHPAAARARA